MPSPQGTKPDAILQITTSDIEDVQHLRSCKVQFCYRGEGEKESTSEVQITNVEESGGVSKYLSECLKHHQTTHPSTDSQDASILERIWDKLPALLSEGFVDDYMRAFTEALPQTIQETNEDIQLDDVPIESVEDLLNLLADEPVELPPSGLYQPFDNSTTPPVGTTALPSVDTNEPEAVDVHLLSTEKRERDETVDISEDGGHQLEQERWIREEDFSVFDKDFNIFPPPPLFGDNEFGVAPALEGFDDQYINHDQMEFTLTLRHSEIQTEFY
ncbi:hypothetical protein PROFUN_09230 [Planoprotostelium fungivorum]|uniref:Uncharacterized protein n=1 Tax=Planoprotostelium fungivorum TaxID=1890364 RepID=A0A2P6NHP1_9EUKA|nr:hypothetical protein PROFUN_09230 [Planoprotostelium fungivorum]